MPLGPVTPLSADPRGLPPDPGGQQRAELLLRVGRVLLRRAEREQVDLGPMVHGVGAGEHLDALLLESGREALGRLPVHLHVGDLSAASAFFSEALGFDTTVWDYPGALFFAASGYHHHLGTNTWAGRDAQPPTEADAQLLEWTIELPDATALAPIADSLVRAGHPVERVGEGGAEPALLTKDPWGTRLRVWVAQAGPRMPPTW